MNRLGGGLRLSAGALVLGMSQSANAAFDSIDIFGDSLSDTGNLYNSVANIVGLQAANAAFAGYPGGNGRLSNGPIWVDYFATANPAINVTTFAIAGAMANTYGGTDNTGDFALGSVPFIGAALQAAAGGLASELGNAAGKLPDLTGTGSALVVWIGANDLLSARELGFANATDAVPFATAAVSSAVTTLLDMHPDDLFLVNLPDLGRTPRANQLQDNADLTAASVAFNGELAQIAGSAASGVTLVDMFDAFNRLLDDPAAAGFSDVTSSCLSQVLGTTVCADPAGLLFWDPVHPTTHGQEYVAAILQGALAPVPLPSAFLLILSGLAMLWRMGSPPTPRYPASL